MPTDVLHTEANNAANSALEQRIKRLELEYQAVLDAAVDAVIVIDAQGVIELANHSAERLFDYSEDDLIGRSIGVLMPEPYRSQHEDRMRRYLETHDPQIIGTVREVQAVRRDGTQFAAEFTVGPINGSQPQRFVGFIRDITARQRTADETREMQDRLMHFGRISTMGEMAAGIAHEINQPLTAIATYAQGCQRILGSLQLPQSDDLATGLQQIESQALRAGEVIRRLRSFVQNKEVRRELIYPNHLLDDLLMLAQTDTRHHNVRIRLEPGKNLPQVLADPVQIQQVMLNLVRNGIDAMLEVRHEYREIQLRTLLNDEGYVEFVVADRGPGLPDAVKNRLFDPFFTTKAGGTGLGLPISLSIVRAHGGKVWYRPNEGGGACFCFSLPAVVPG